MERSEDRTVIFLHIPKTGGTTLHAILARQYWGRSIYTSPGGRRKDCDDGFSQLSPAERGGLALVKGHMFFGWDAMLPQPATYVTMLRNPVDRVVSQYQQLLRAPGGRSAPSSLAAYIASGDKCLDNLQTRMVSGMGAELGGCSDRHLACARRNLETRFEVAGITERFDESLLLMKHAFGWRMPFYGRHRVTARRARAREIDSRTVDLILERNALDVQLFEFAAALLGERVTARGAAVARELRAFRWLNAPIHAIYSSVVSGAEACSLK